jgi:hypothetical protein
MKGEPPLQGREAPALHSGSDPKRPARRAAVAGRRRWWATVLLALVAVPLLARAAPSATGLAPTVRTYGGPPRIGFYELSGVGSRFLVWRDFAGRYRLSLLRIRIRRGAAECRRYRDRLATVPGDHALRRLLVRRDEETEISYGSTRTYEFAAADQDKVRVSVDGRLLPAELSVDIGEGPTAEKPVVGQISIGTDGLDCTVGFVGGPRRPRAPPPARRSPGRQLRQ